MTSQYMTEPNLILQADALEHALMAALPLGPQSAAGGISLPDSFHGELQVDKTSNKGHSMLAFSMWRGKIQNTAK